MTKAALRQRILGAVVIISLGFILYSIFLQSDARTYIDRSTQIPLQTQFIEPLELDDLPSEEETPEAVPDALDLYTPVRSVSVEEIQSAPVLNDDGKPNSWVIQVGSFSTLERAIEIRDELIVEGIKAYTRTQRANEDHEELYKVVAGPYVDANEIIAHQAKIDAQLGVSTILMVYEF